MDLAQMIGMLAFFAGLTVFFLLYAIYAPIVEREEENQKIKTFLMKKKTKTITKQKHHLILWVNMSDQF